MLCPDRTRNVSLTFPFLYGFQLLSESKIYCREGSLIAPFFPTEAEKRGISSTVVGLVISTYTFVCFIGSFVTGMLVRALGLRFLMGAGMFLAGGAVFLFGFIDQMPQIELYIFFAFAIRFVQGVGSSMYMSASFIIAAALYPNQISFAYATLEMGLMFGKIVGPTLGGVLFDIGGFKLPFNVVGLTHISIGLIVTILVVLATIYLPDLAKLEQHQRSTHASDQLQPPSVPWSVYFKQSAHGWLICGMHVIAAIVLSFPEPTLSLRLTELGLDDATQIGFVFLCCSLGYAVACLIVGKLSDVFPSKSYLLMAIGAVAYGIAYILAGPSPLFISSFLPASIVQTIATIAVVYIGVALVVSPIPKCFLLTMRHVGYPDSMETSSFIASIYNAMWFGGGMLGPIIAGALVDAFQYPWASSTMALLALVQLILAVIAMVLVLKGRGTTTNPFANAVDILEHSQKSLSLFYSQPI